jgi:hypothetical protein
MSNRQMDENRDEKQALYVAQKLGISAEDLYQTKWEIEAKGGSDTFPWAHYVKFSPDSPPEILAKIEGLKNYCVDIHIEEEPDEEFDPYDDGDEKLTDEERKIAEQEMFRIAEENRRKGLGN